MLSGLHQLNSAIAHLADLSSLDLAFTVQDCRDGSYHRHRTQKVLRDLVQLVGSNLWEVGGGDLERLKEVSANMDRVFGLTPNA